MTDDVPTDERWGAHGDEDGDAFAEAQRAPAVELPTDGPDTELAAAWLTDAEAEQEAVEWFRRRNRHGTDPEDWIADGGDGQRHAATIVRAVLARPAAGRDLTAQDVRDAARGWAVVTSAAAPPIAEQLNGIARPGATKDQS